MFMPFVEKHKHMSTHFDFNYVDSFNKTSKR